MLIIIKVSNVWERWVIENGGVGSQNMSVLMRWSVTGSLQHGV